DYIRAASINDAGIALGLNNGRIVHYNKYGEQSWTRKTDDQIGTVRMKDRTILAGLRDGKILVFHDDGDLVYSQDLGSGVVSVDGNGVYTIAGTLDNRVYLTGPTGIVKWFMEFDGRLVSTYMDLDNIIVGSTSGRLAYTRPPSRTPTESLIMGATMMTVIVGGLLVFMRNWGRY
ncbi:MAG: hypothetical protein ABIH11_06970, partial [Candidatus Altiarchaeota archaeon]